MVVPVHYTVATKLRGGESDSDRHKISVSSIKKALHT